jgi:hypothetical protein
MSTLPSLPSSLSHLKFEHNKNGPPPLVVGILLVVGCITLVMHSNLKTAINPQKERKKRREKSVGFGVHQYIIILSL